MATFFMFGKYSAEAIKAISAERTQKVVDVVKKSGGEVKSMHALLGEKDLVFIVSLPGMEQAIQVSVALSKMTGIAFTTAPAVTVDDFDKLMAEI
ncbi:MAG: GYD domain-containing protein [Syntrophobacteria bacterium]|jgi:uncharacterized protein with GYD domain